MKTAEGGAKYGASVAHGRLERPACTRRPRRAMADPMRSATRAVWRALLVRPLLQLGRNHQMAVVTGGVTSRVGDVPGDSGTTWPRSSRGGEPERGYQSPPQSSSKPPDSAEKCEWLSAAMRRAGRLAGRPFSPCFTLVSRTFHARSLLAIIWQFTGLAPSLAPKAVNQYKTHPPGSPAARHPTQCDIHGGLFGGFGGSGEGDRLTR